MLRRRRSRRPHRAIVACALHRAGRWLERLMEQQLLAAAESDPAVMIRCVDECERCHRMSLRTAMAYCLEQGVDPSHLRLMFACAELCRATADAVLAAFDIAEDLCALCARVCAQCADSCDRVGDLQDCAEVCRSCAGSLSRGVGRVGRARAGRERVGLKPDLREFPTNAGIQQFA
jgi:hypothetical protein